jgi:hypothetical protein
VNFQRNSFHETWWSTGSHDTWFFNPCLQCIQGIFGVCKDGDVHRWSSALLRLAIVLTAFQRFGGNKLLPLCGLKWYVLNLVCCCELYETVIQRLVFGSQSNNCEVSYSSVRRSAESVLRQTVCLHNQGYHPADGDMRPETLNHLQLPMFTDRIQSNPWLNTVLIHLNPV